MRVWSLVSALNHQGRLSTSCSSSSSSPASALQSSLAKQSILKGTSSILVRKKPQSSKMGRLRSTLQDSSPSNAFARNISSSSRSSSLSAVQPPAGAAEIDVQLMRLQYTEAQRDESVIDNLHGHKIADPYRLLENPEAKETQEFVQKNVELAASVLEKCITRDKLKKEITALFDYPKYSCPYKRGKHFFYTCNNGLQAQSVVYIQETVEGDAEVLLDPNTWSEDGTVALATMEFSHDAEYVAYGQSASGSDWITIKVMHVADRFVQPDTLSWVKFTSLTWTHDNKGFFYNRYPEPQEKEAGMDAGTETEKNLFHELCYHLLGTDQSEDVLCWRSLEHPQWLSGAEITSDGQYLLLSIAEGCDPVNRLYYFDLTTLPDGGFKGWKGSNKQLPFKKLIDNFEAQYHLVANNKSVFTFLTNKNAPRYKLVRVDLNNPSDWTDVIPESNTDVLVSATCVNLQQLLVCYMTDVKHQLRLHDLETGLLLHQLPLEIGSVTETSGRREDSQVYFNFTSFLTPGIIYWYDLSSSQPELKVLRETAVANFDRTSFEIKQVFVQSKDSTKIPMFIVAQKGLDLDGQHPALLYGYGGFNVSLTPSFSVARLVLAKHLGAVIAIANIRGGGEYGEEWHKAGSLARKQNCFDDFIACSEYLVKEQYTQPKKLCIEGGSNGGLLVAACINQRPDLFGCALAHVGVMDMLRFHKFTIGHAWTSDYGCADNKEEFQWLIKYSPLHNVRRPWEQTPGVQYPATMLLTADHDDRVVPLHSLKLLATLQYELCTSVENSPQTNPIIGRIDTKAGHGSGRPTQKVIDEASDSYSFFAMVTKSTWID